MLGFFYQHSANITYKYDFSLNSYLLVQYWSMVLHMEQYEFEGLTEIVILSNWDLPSNYG